MHIICNWWPSWIWLVGSPTAILVLQSTKTFPPTRTVISISFAITVTVTITISISLTFTFTFALAFPFSLAFALPLVTVSTAWDCSAQITRVSIPHPLVSFSPAVVIPTSTFPIAIFILGP